MGTYEYSFTTKPFEAKIIEFKFYQDPVNSEIRNAVATIEFNFPVNPDSLEKNTTLMFQAVKKGDLDLNAEPVKFSYTYDEHTTCCLPALENIKIKNVARYLLLTLGKNTCFLH